MKYPFIDKTTQEAQYRVTGSAFFEDIKIAYPYPIRVGLYDRLNPMTILGEDDFTKLLETSHYDLAKDES